MAGRREDGAAVDHPQGVRHAQAQAFEHGGEVPGIDRQAIGRGLAAHRGEPGAVQQRRQQRMPGERLVEPGERGGGLRQGGGERRIKRSGARRSQQRVRAIASPRPIGPRGASLVATGAARRPCGVNQWLTRELTQTRRFGAMTLLYWPTPLPRLGMPDKASCRA